MTLLWCNGQWLDPLDFWISPSDRGLMHGLGLFETLLAVDGAPVFVERHLARLYEACKRLAWPVEYPGIREAIVELLHVNGLTEGRARIRLSVTAGSGTLRDLSLGADHLAWMTAAPMVDVPVSTSVCLSPWPRNEHSPLAGLKCASYAENLLAQQHAERLGFEETLFLNTAGHLCEAATSNVFLVKNGGLHTPSLAAGCLPGITRAVVMELAHKLGIPCEEKRIPMEALRDADELFLTSSIRGVMALSRFEQRMLAPGPVTHRLREAWNATALGKNHA